MLTFLGKSTSTICFEIKYCFFSGETNSNKIIFNEKVFLINNIYANNYTRNNTDNYGYSCVL